MSVASEIAAAAHGGSDRVAARLGGGALLVASLSFVAVFSVLAVRFNYPDVLDGSASEVLPRLLQLGDSGRAIWALYAVLPLLLLPAGIGVHAVLRRSAPGAGRLTLTLAPVAALTMLLGLSRWPSAHWALAEAWAASQSEVERAAISHVFAALNLYLGNYLGEFIGELALNLFFLVAALGGRHEPSLPRWSVAAGLLAAVFGLIGLWRNVTPTVAIIAEIENVVLPLWLAVLGVLIIRAGGRLQRV